MRLTPWTLGTKRELVDTGRPLIVGLGLLLFYLFPVFPALSVGIMQRLHEGDDKSVHVDDSVIRPEIILNQSMGYWPHRATGLDDV